MRRLRRALDRSALVAGWSLFVVIVALRVSAWRHRRRERVR